MIKISTKKIRMVLSFNTFFYNTTLCGQLLSFQQPPQPPEPFTPFMVNILISSLNSSGIADPAARLFVCSVFSVD